MTAFLALVMSACLLVLFVVGSLGSFIVAETSIPRAQLGMLVTAAFLVGTIASLVAGVVLDKLGTRACLLMALVSVASSLGLFSIAPTYEAMVGAAVVAGLGLAFANPVTNKLIQLSVPAARQGIAMGIKQSGVPFAGFLAGTPLTAVASTWGWRWALRIAAAAIALLLGVGMLMVRRVATAEKRPAGILRVRAPNGFVKLLMLYSFFIGGGVAALNTYLALYAHEGLGLTQAMAANLVAVVGVTGVVSRIAWAIRSGKRDGALSSTLRRLAFGGACSATLVAAARLLGAGALWIGALGLGAFGVAANAVSMLAVVKTVPSSQVGHASALVALGFFGGFIASPVVVGALVDGGLGYGVGWLFVAAQFSGAAICGIRLEGDKPGQVAPSVAPASNSR